MVGVQGVNDILQRFERITGGISPSRPESIENINQMRFEIQTGWFEKTGVELPESDIDSISKYYFNLKDGIEDQRDMYAEIGNTLGKPSDLRRSRFFKDTNE